MEVTATRLVIKNIKHSLEIMEKIEEKFVDFSEKFSIFKFSGKEKHKLNGKIEDFREMLTGLRYSFEKHIEYHSKNKPNIFLFDNYHLIDETKNVMSYNAKVKELDQFFADYPTVTFVCLSHTLDSYKSDNKETKFNFIDCNYQHPTNCLIEEIENSVYAIPNIKTEIRLLINDVSFGSDDIINNQINLLAGEYKVSIFNFKNYMNSTKDAKDASVEKFILGIDSLLSKIEETEKVLIVVRDIQRIFNYGGKDLFISLLKQYTNTKFLILSRKEVSIEGCDVVSFSVLENSPFLFAVSDIMVGNTIVADLEKQEKIDNQKLSEIEITEPVEKTYTAMNAISDSMEEASGFLTNIEQSDELGARLHIHSENHNKLIFKTLSSELSDNLIYEHFIIDIADLDYKATANLTYVSEKITELCNKKTTKEKIIIINNFSLFDKHLKIGLLLETHKDVNFIFVENKKDNFTLVKEINHVETLSTNADGKKDAEIYFTSDADLNTKEGNFIYLLHQKLNPRIARENIQTTIPNDLEKGRNLRLLINAINGDKDYNNALMNYVFSQQYFSFEIFDFFNLDVKKVNEFIYSDTEKEKLIIIRHYDTKKVYHNYFDFIFKNNPKVAYILVSDDYIGNVQNGVVFDMIDCKYCSVTLFKEKLEQKFYEKIKIARKIKQPSFATGEIEPKSLQQKHIDNQHNIVSDKVHNVIGSTEITEKVNTFGYNPALRLIVTGYQTGLGNYNVSHINDLLGDYFDTFWISGLITKNKKSLAQMIGKLLDVFTFEKEGKPLCIVFEDYQLFQLIDFDKVLEFFMSTNKKVHIVLLTGELKYLDLNKPMFNCFTSVLHDKIKENEEFIFFTEDLDKPNKSFLNSEKVLDETPTSEDFEKFVTKNYNGKVKICKFGYNENVEEYGIKTVRLTKSNKISINDTTNFGILNEIKFVNSETGELHEDYHLEFEFVDEDGMIVEHGFSPSEVENKVIKLKGKQKRKKKKNKARKQAGVTNTIVDVSKTKIKDSNEHRIFIITPRTEVDEMNSLLRGYAVNGEKPLGKPVKYIERKDGVIFCIGSDTNFGKVVEIRDFENTGILLIVKDENKLKVLNLELEDDLKLVQLFSKDCEKMYVGDICYVVDSSFNEPPFESEITKFFSDKQTERYYFKSKEKAYEYYQQNTRLFSMRDVMGLLHDNPQAYNKFVSLGNEKLGL